MATADLGITLCGVRLKTPFVLASGPLSHDGRALAAACQAGAGAAVTKTISRVKADNPMPHMVRAAQNTLINCEEWSDLEAIDWIEREIGVAKEAGAVVIASVGLAPDDVKELAARVWAAGPDLVEVVSYTEGSIVPMVKEARRLGKGPLLAKVSPNWPTVVKTAVECVKAGADGITATDSFGPVLRIDVATAKPLLGGPYGYGWLSGQAIKPIVIRIVSEIARAVDVPIVGTGGVVRGEDALEMLMAGATAVGLASTPILQGLKSFGRLGRELGELLGRYGYANPASARGIALPNLVEGKRKERLVFDFEPEVCTECRLCVDLCPYGARRLEGGKKMLLDDSRCRHCSLCASVCATGALGVSGGLRNRR